MKLNFGDLKLALVGVLVFVVVIYMAVTSVTLIDYNTTVFVADMQSQDVVEQISGNIDLLQDTANAISADKEVVQNVRE